MKLHTKTTQFLRQTGVTLVEMVVVIVILAIALTTLTQMLSQVTVSGAYTYDETMAIELGQSYISEIMGRRYDENSPLGGIPPCGAPSAAACSTSFNDGESRASYDDVDDYDGLDELPQRVDGSGGVEAREGYENFRVAVSVSQATSTAKRITVTITQPNSETIDLTVYKTNF